MRAIRSLRTTGMLIVSASLAISMAACGSSSSSSSASLKKTSDLKDPTSPVTINYVGAAYPPEALAPVFAAFEKAHPTIKVKFESVPFDDLNNVLSVRLGSGNSDLDVFDVDMPRTDAYEARGWLVQLNDAFGDLSSSIDKASIEAATVGNKLVAIPMQTSTNIMYYNKALLSKAGVSSPSTDPAARMTWEQVATDARKVQSAGAKWGLLFDQVDRYYQLQTLAESAGGGPGGKGDGNLTPDLTNAGWGKALSWYGKQFADKVSPKGVPTAQTSDLFAAGQVAFYPGGPWWAPKFLGAKNLDFGVTAYPAFEGGKAAVPTGGWSLAVNKKSKNAEAAEIFVKFMTLDNGGFSQYMTDLAVPPTNIKGAEKYYTQATFSKPAMNGAVAIMKNDIADNSVLRLQTVGYVEFEDILTKSFTDIINGTLANDALTKANADVDAAWAKYRK